VKYEKNIHSRFHGLDRVNALDIVAQHPGRFQVVALAGGVNLEKMEEQILRFRPELVSLLDPESVRRLQESLPGKFTRFLSGMEGLMAVATHPEAEIVLCALAGSIGLLPTLAAVRARKNLAIANKEPLVMAGEILLREIQENRVHILPVDSEHSAIFQALAGHRQADIHRLILTASGGPFLNTPLKELGEVTPHKL